MASTTSSASQKLSSRRQWPLAAVLTLRFALVGAISLAALAVVIVWHIVPALRADLEDHHRAFASSVASQVDAYFSVADRELRALSFLLDSKSASHQEITQLLDSFVSASSFYEAIYYSDEKGRVFAIGLPESLRQVRKNHLGLDISQRDFVREARERVAPIWSNIFLSPVSLRPAVAIAIPVGSRLLIGEVAVTPLPTLAQKLMAGSSLTVMILDRQNQLTAHSDNLYSNQQMNLGHLSLVAAARAGKPTAQTEFELDGHALVGTAWSIPDLDWLVVVAQPTEKAYAQIEAVWKRFAIAILFAILAVSGAAIWTARVLTRRFTSYSTQAARIAHGNYFLEWEDQTNIRQFEDLRTSLQSMADAILERESGLRQAQTSLQVLNQTLEDRVDERTDELSRANEELVVTLETLQNAQTELLRAEKLASLGSMVAGIAHELNTPIGNAVMIASTLADHDRDLLREIESGNLRRSSLTRHLADHHSATDILVRNLQRASELIRSFKQVAVDQTSAQRRTFRLKEVTGEIILALHPMLKKTAYKIETDIDDEIWLDSFPGPLGQVLTNLINNAVLHAFDGRDHGTITITGKNSTHEEIELMVIDDGKGIPQENLDKVFDPFFTTRLGKGGSGLGLNIVHSLVTRVLGGTINVYSVTTEGTRFMLRLPKKAPFSADRI